ncbi:MAG: hypothetical protein LWW75_02190 [Chlorobiales bacterium]|nr:hypothetical protein [Chlorobiales bacterium]
MAAFDFGRKIDDAVIDSLLSREYDPDFGAALRKGMEMFKEHIGEFAGFTLILMLVSALSSRLAGGSSLIVSIASIPLFAGFMIGTFKLLAGHELHFNDLFSGYRYFLPLALAGMASSLIVAAGMVLLIVPGIYFLVSYLFVSALVVDYGMEFWQAMETSRKLVSRHWLRLFVFVLLILSINLLGLLALGIGLLVTIPVTSCAVAVVYRSIAGDHGPSGEVNRIS